MDGLPRKSSLVRSSEPCSTLSSDRPLLGAPKLVWDSQATGIAADEQTLHWSSILPLLSFTMRSPCKLLVLLSLSDEVSMVSLLPDDEEMG